MRKRRATLLVDAGIWLRLAGDEEGARKLFEQALSLDPDNRQAAQLLSATSGAGGVGPKTVPVEAPVLEPSAPVAARKPPVRGPPKPEAQRAARPAEPSTGAEPSARTMPVAPARIARAEIHRAPVLQASARPDHEAPLATPEGEFRGFDTAEVLGEQEPEHATIPWLPPTQVDAPRAGDRALHRPPAPRTPTKPPVPDETSSLSIAAAASEAAASRWLGSNQPVESGAPPSAPAFSAESTILPSLEGEPPAVRSRQDAVIQYLRETDAYLRYGIYEKALEFAAKVLAEDPENGEAYDKAKAALLASKGSAAAFEQLLKVLRLFAGRLDAERAGPFLDELMAQQPGHPELPVLLSVLRPYELELSGWSAEGPLLDQALVAYLEGPMNPMASGDLLDTLPPEATVPAGFQLPAPFRMARPEGEVPPHHGAHETLPHGVSLVGASPRGADGNDSEVTRHLQAPIEEGSTPTPQEQPKPLYADDEAEAPQPPFRRPKRRR
jgi:tetratricopeptide (TPR) repeat protein